MAPLCLQLCPIELVHDLDERVRARNKHRLVNMLCGFRCVIVGYVSYAWGHDQNATCWALRGNEDTPNYLTRTPVKHCDWLTPKVFLQKPLDDEMVPGVERQVAEAAAAKVATVVAIEEQRLRRVGLQRLHLAVDIRVAAKLRPRETKVTYALC